MFRVDLQRELIAEMARVCRPGGLVVAELESLHKGLFVTRVLEQRRHRRTTKYTAMWEVRQLFPADVFPIVKVRGAVFPKLYKLFYRMPSIGEAVERLAFIPPFNWMAARVAVAATRK
jgi:ubiquinone/menaquinone biosynthesis C-methylase UbiE